MLTRPVGTGPLWLAINTMAAAGAALDWAHRTFFADLPGQRFFSLVDRLGGSIPVCAKAGQDAAKPVGGEPVQFEADLAGSRMHVLQRYGAVKGLQLSTTREEILAALLSGLAERSRRRLRVLAGQTRPNGTVYLAGGASGSGVTRLWQARYKTVLLPEDASLRGLVSLAARGTERRGVGSTE